VRRQTIISIWIGGAILALVLYVVGPDNFLSLLLNALDDLEAAFHRLLYFLGTQAFNVVRALALAIFTVFVVLALMAAYRGLRAIGALIVVSLGFLILVWRPDTFYTASVSRWFAALVLAIIGAVVMTQRLLAPPPGPRPPPPWPPQPGRPL
jgi:hypothetical protein